MQDEPLIYTSMGNLPIAVLKHEPSWEVTDTYVKFIDTYTLDGEVVKQSAHVMVKRGVESSAIAGQFQG